MRSRAAIKRRQMREKPASRIYLRHNPVHFSTPSFLPNVSKREEGTTMLTIEKSHVVKKHIYETIRI